MSKLSKKKIKSRKAVSKGTERKKSKKIVRGGNRKNTVRLISRAPSPRSPTRAAIEKKKTKKGGGAPPGLLLLKAVKSGNYNDVYELLEKGANPNYIGRDENGEVITPLIIACKNGNLEIIDLLVDNGAKINEKISGMSQIYRSILMDDDIDVIKKLILLEADVNTKDEGKYGATPLSASINKQNVELVKLLVLNGANVNQLVYTNNKFIPPVSPLSIACQYGHTEIVRFLKEKKAQGGC
jgi:ankyrin repeat protein